MGGWTAGSVAMGNKQHYNIHLWQLWERRPKCWLRVTLILLNVLQVCFNLRNLSYDVLRNLKTNMFLVTLTFSNKESRGYRQWEASSCEASLIFFNEQKQEKRFNVLLHASVCRGQCSFLYRSLPLSIMLGFSRSCALRLSHLVLCQCLKAPAQQFTNILSSNKHSTRTSVMWKSHAASRLCTAHIF